LEVKRERMADFGDAVFVEVKERGSLIFREDS